MSDNHLTEPLDYLYEELPPERMAEARRHLAVCPDCRAKVRDIRETVKRYRRIPRPTPPPGLAARAAAKATAAAAAAKQPPQPEPVVLATPPARARIPASDAAEQASEQRQVKLEEDFERLKQEVKEEMRRGWRQWFFHPAWTIAASALLLASLAIHYSPRERYEQPIRLRESESRTFIADSAAARDIRNRERIPAPQPQSAGAAAIVSAEAGDDPDQPVLSTPLPPAPAALREANARRDLPLPPLAPMRANSAAQPERMEVAQMQKTAEPAETAKAEESMEIASATVPPPQPAAAPVAKTSAAVEQTLVAEASVAAEPAPAFDEEVAHAAPAVPAPAAAPVPPAAPAQSGEITPVLTPAELASLVAMPVDEDDAEAAVIAMAEMTPPQVVERPEGFDMAERIRTLSALAGMQIASGEIADAWKTVDMLRRYSPAAAEEISALITEAEKAALKTILTEEEPTPTAEPEPPPESPPASPVPVAPAPDLPFPGAMIEPPENPPLSMVIVPAYMQPATTEENAPGEEIVTMPEAGEPVISEPMVSEFVVPAPDAALRETLEPSRAVELARTLRQSLDPVIPLQVYIRPVAPAPVFVSAPEPAPAAVPKKSKQKRFITTPYLNDY